MSWVMWSPPSGITAESVRVPRREDADVGGAAADVNQDGGQFAFAVGQDGQPRRERLDNHAVYLDARVLGAAAQVLQRALRSGDDMDVNL